MEIQLIRNATMKITYAGRTILTDPMLSTKGEFRSFAGIAQNPTVDLPISVEEILSGVDFVVVSHNHPDHIDPTAVAALPKATPVLCQPVDERHLMDQGFLSVKPIETSHVWEGITITRTGGMHGTGEILELMGQVSGFVFQAPDEPTVYWVGDSVLCEPVADIISSFTPDIIITHSGGARIPGYNIIVMDAEQTIKTAQAAPKAVIVAVHLESLDHCEISRDALRRMADQTSISPSRLVIPADGETVKFRADGSLI